MRIDIVGKKTFIAPPGSLRVFAYADDEEELIVSATTILDSDAVMVTVGTVALHLTAEQVGKLAVAIKRLQDDQ